MKNTTLTKVDLKRVTEKLQKAGGLAIKVGVLSRTGGDLATYAAANEFGTATIPERSFLRSTMHEQRAKYTRGMAKGISRAVVGLATLEKVLGLTGLEITKDIQLKITDLADPPNAPATIARKGSSNPLIDTGRLRQSIAFEIVKVPT